MRRPLLARLSSVREHRADGALVKLLALGLFQACLASAQLSCRDEQDREVPWYTIYKMPLSHLKPSSDGRSAFPPHLYLDAHDPTWKWSQEGRGLDSPAQAVGFTLKQIYEAQNEKDDLGYFFYNDGRIVEMPADDFGVNRAHAKGAFAISADGRGFWLVHSVPKYPPPAANGYGYPRTGWKYGQHFLCITLGQDDIDRIGYQMRLNDVWLYDAHWPEALQTLSSNLTELSRSLVTVAAADASDRASADASVTSDVYALKTTPESGEFVTFAKSADFGKDLYHGLIAPHLRSDLLAQTWSHGPQTNNMNSTCDSVYKVLNIASLANKELGVDFSNSDDHSKFAVSSNDFVCVGDINRQMSQKKRGGGAVCFRSQPAAQAYRSLVGETQPCSEPSSSTHSDAPASHHHYDAEL